MSVKPVVIEVAINGETTRAENPNVPTTAEQLAADALACLEVGASIVHFHGCDLSLYGQEAADRYVEVASRFLSERPDALWYPTGTTGPTAEMAYAHVEALADVVGLRLGPIDPGTTNFGWPDEDGLPTGRSYGFTYQVIRYRMALLERRGMGASLGIYEPGFLRTALAYEAAGRLPRGSYVKLYFGVGSMFGLDHGRGVSFGLPPTEKGLLAYAELLAGSRLEWFVQAVGGDVIESPAAALALELGGHLQVGLEFHFDRARNPTNVELVREAVAMAGDAGRPIATPVEAGAMLGLPAHDQGQFARG